MSMRVSIFEKWSQEGLQVYIYLAEYNAMSPAMKGSDMKANPPSAIGSFSASLISSIFEEKYSSGSFSLVSFLGSSPSPSPNPIFTTVFSEDARVIDLATARGVEGAKALVAIKRVANSAKIEVRRYMMFSNNSMVVLSSFEVYVVEPTTSPALFLLEIDSMID